MNQVIHFPLTGSQNIQTIESQDGSAPLVCLTDRVLIAGAGIAGLAAAAALQKVGIPAVVLERESGPRLQVRFRDPLPI